jgi:FkbH-like protein
MTIALLSNVNVTSLAMKLNKTAREEVYCPSGYNTWIQEISDPSSRLYANEPSAVFIFLHGRELLSGGACDDPKAAEEILSPMSRVIAAAAAEHKGIVFVASTLDVPIRKIRPLISRGAETHACAFWKHSLEDLGVPILDLAEMVSAIGRKSFYNDRIWYMGSMPLSKTGEELLASEMGRIYRAIRGPRKKCLVLDLDNTLWGGAVGELGVEGIHLDMTGSGSRFRDFQQRILNLKENGVLLAVISKNYPDDAMNCIKDHAAMVLREKDFAAIRTNWEPKPDNLLSIANELNIGTDSFVFIDDNPIERETMRLSLPEVAVPNFPEDSSQLESFMIDVAREYFLQIRTTEEDTDKTEQYKAESGRREHKSAFADVREYLSSLNMVLSVERLARHNIPRAAQLTQKTNQFNLTARRYSEAEMASASGDAGLRVYIGGLSDRFGDYGKIALCIARVSGESASIENFLMSCRVMDRGVERAFLRFVERDLNSAGVTKVNSEYVPTSKNGIVRDFWENMGYKAAAKTESGGTRYMAELPGIDADTAPCAIKINEIRT